MAAPTSKSKVRFQERAELLDFLLDVSAATSDTLDLDRILANVAAIVKDVMPYDLFAILILERVCDEQEENSIRLANRLPLRARTRPMQS